MFSETGEAERFQGSGSEKIEARGDRTNLIWCETNDLLEPYVVSKKDLRELTSMKTILKD